MRQGTLQEVGVRPRVLHFRDIRQLDQSQPREVNRGLLRVCVNVVPEEIRMRCRDTDEPVDEVWVGMDQ